MQLTAVVAVVVILHVPLGNYMARVYSTTADWRLERAIYRIVGVQPADHQRWTKYLSSLLAFSAVSVLFLYALLLFASIFAGAVGPQRNDTGISVQYGHFVYDKHELAELPQAKPPSAMSGWPPVSVCRRSLVAQWECASRLR